MFGDTIGAKLFFSAAQRKLFAQAAPVFTYHKVGPVSQASRDPFLSVSSPAFAAQMRTIAEAGFQTASLDEAVDSKPGNANRKLILTFDDGYEDVFHNAMPVLNRHGMRAIVYLVAGQIGGCNAWDVAKNSGPERLMDETQIREWLAAGHEIGSHSLTHPNLRRIPLAAARSEICDSKRKLEDLFQREIAHFCFPHGAFNETLCDFVAEAGYRTAVTVRFGINLPGSSLFALSRIVPLTGLELLAKIQHRFCSRAGGDSSAAS